MQPARRMDQPTTPSAPSPSTRLAITSDTPSPGPSPQAVQTLASLGASLGPILHEACGDRLGDIEWFNSPWQRSGSSTGRTWWRLPSGEVIPAIVKAPVGYREWFWTTRLGEADPMMWDHDGDHALPVPRVLSSGLELGGYDLAWLVVERIPDHPLSKGMTRPSLDQLFRAAARFHRLAADIQDPTKADPPPERRWTKLFERSRESLVDNKVENASGWTRALDAVDARLPMLVERWAARPMNTWCHGDLHPGNVMVRPETTDGLEASGVLIDLGLVHPGHWIEDALYLERLHWGREEMLCGLRPLLSLAQRRSELGFPAMSDEDARLAGIRRVLMAATSPAFLAEEGDPRYLAAALRHIETGLSQIPD
ncbi:MAG: hypothetical protein CMJ31_03225 [Phycisphaerae bacterium]|nr:hypothetical protein [Phycisphaerae bacterium]